MKTIGVLMMTLCVMTTKTYAQDATPAPTLRLDWTPYVVLVAGQTADAATTAYNYRRGFTESNPLFGQHAPLSRVVTIKAAETAGLSVLVWQLQRTGHPKMARFIGWFGGIGGVVPAVINASAQKGGR